MQNLLSFVSARGEASQRLYLTVAFLASAVVHNVLRYLPAADPLPLVYQGGILLVVGEQTARYTLPVWLLVLLCLWVTGAVTVQRLRALRLPVSLALIVLIPVLNVLFLALVAVLPNDYGNEPQRGWARYLPRSRVGSASAGIVGAVIFLIFAGMAVSVGLFQSYGLMLFVGLPFSAGLMSVLLFGYHAPRSFLECLQVACLTIVITGLVLVGCALEGAICVVMAAPFALSLAIVGGTVGYFVQNRYRRTGTQISCVASLSLVLIVGEGFTPREAPLYAAVTTHYIEAPPEKVWNNVVAFSELPPPDEWVFRTGIAYPVRARIEGEGKGAIRYCEFSTGAFVEPIEEWDPPKRLRFSVTSTPPPMQEWSPYHEISPSHLHGFFESEGGQFELVPVGSGATRVEATTWYRHRIFPAPYWSMWAEPLLHTIHRRVLRHIDHLSTGRTSAPDPS